MNRSHEGMTDTLTSIQVENLVVAGYEKIVKVHDPISGLKAIIALHNTTMGPALGGTRIYPYASEEAALIDVLRLSKGMTYKAALAQVGLGGGKSVIIADPKAGGKTRQVLEAFADVVHSLQGSYICAEDVGCSVDDVDIIKERTPYVVGLKNDNSSGDPSIFTAWGTFIGMKATWDFLVGKDSLKGIRVVVQGLGAVGEKLVEWLFWEGAKVIVSDVDSQKVKKLVKKYQVESVDPNNVFDVDCDIFAPCAMGGVIRADVIPRLKCHVIAGCANNQLLELEDDLRLIRSGILYAPDFVINAGGLINVSFEIQKNGYNAKDAREAVAKIPERLRTIYQIAKEKKIGTQQAATILGDDLLEKKE